MEYQHWLREAINQLQASESPRRDAEILLGHVTGRARTWLLAFGETVLTGEQQAQLVTLLSRRQRGEPVAHLVGEREFWSLPLFVSPATLIPRPDTECLVEQALARELDEELGIRIDQIVPWKIQMVDYPHALVRLNFCKVFDWEGELQMREGQSFAWQHLPVQVAPVLPGTVPVLQWFAAEQGFHGATY